MRFKMKKVRSDPLWLGCKLLDLHKHEREH